MNIGTIVRVLAPFADTYHDNYAITEILVSEGAPAVYILGDLGGFDAKYLEKVA